MLWWNLRRLKSNDVQTRRRAIKGLSKSRSPRALAALMAALGDESHLARKEAAEALGEIGDAQAVKPLINLIEGSVHYAIAKSAVGALERVLVRVAASVASKDVQVAAAISDVSGIYYELREGAIWFSEAKNATPWIMDCSHVRRLARQELTRRWRTGRSSDKPSSSTIQKGRKVYGRTSIRGR
jgi:HEAT repeat protein